MPSQRSRRGTSFITLAMLVALVVGVGLYLFDVLTCSGGEVCESERCTHDDPCGVDVTGDGVTELCYTGQVCTNEGQLCEDHWGWSDCTCTTVAGTGGVGSCRAVCAKTDVL